MRRSSETIPALAVAVAAAAWGVYWIPQRALEGAGLTGGWATLGQFLVPLALMTPVVVIRWRRRLPTGIGLVSVGLLAGGSITFYANSFLLTDVVHALLLFYITPVWGTLIEIAVQRRPPQPIRWLSLMLGLGGIWVVFAVDGGVPLPRNIGDWLALAGGLMIACATARLNAVRPAGMFPQLFAYFFYGSIVAAVSALLLADHLGPTPDAATMAGLVPWLVLLAVAFLIPSNAILLWGAVRVPPGMFGILILAEIVVGMVAAALWADEPFGWREVVGGAMILSAGLVEIVVMARRDNAPVSGP
jgi:drug/metabolite transporter (DMT)-like permease